MDEKKKCRKEDCQKTDLYARGMCFHHYGLFMKKARRAGLNIARPYIKDQLLGVLPCTMVQAIAKLEVHPASAHKAFKKLHSAGKIHISGHEFTGARWAPVYALGAGEDVPLDRDEVYALFLARRRERHAKRNGLRPKFDAFLTPLNTNTRYAVPARDAFAE